MVEYEKISFFRKFRENDKFIYRKIKEFFLKNIKSSIFYFNKLNGRFEDILNNYSIIERQIILKCILSELDSNLSETFKIISSKKESKININKNYEYPNPINEWLENLFDKDNSNKSFRIYD